MNRIWPWASLAVLTSIAVVAACTGDPPASGPANDDDDAGGLADSGVTPASDAATDTSTSCQPGQAACGDSCVDLASSGDHCGACGHSCGGGTCSQSTCAPVVVANNVTNPLGVAVAVGSAFWIRNGAVERCPVTGCTSNPTLISDQVAIGAGQPTGTTIVTDGNFVAWIATGNASNNGLDVFACGVAGCSGGFSPKHSSGLTDAPTQLALEGSTVFSTQRTGAEQQGPIGTLAMTGTGIVSDVPTGITADAQYIFVSGVKQSANGVDRCTRTSGTCTDPTRLFVGSTYIAAAGGFVFATSPDGIKACTTTGCGGAATILNADDKTAGAIAASDKFVAWINPGATDTANGSVRVCKLPNCEGGVRTVADAQPHPVSLTIADGFVYWANSGVAGPGSIWRAAL